MSMIASIIGFLVIVTILSAIGIPTTPLVFVAVFGLGVYFFSRPK